VIKASVKTLEAYNNTVSQKTGHAYYVSTPPEIEHCQ